MSLGTKAEKIDCMEVLKVQRVSEITALTERVEKKTSKNATLDAKIEELNTTIEGLKKVVAIQEGKVVERTIRTQAECRALVGVTKDEKLTCMNDAKAARQAEIAAKTRELEGINAKNETLLEEISRKANEQPD